MPTAIEEPQVGHATGIVEETINDIPDMVCHMYSRVLGVVEWVSRCGVERDTDPHVLLHRSMGVCNTSLTLTMTTCPVCGAPICATCKSMKERRKPE